MVQLIQLNVRGNLDSAGDFLKPMLTTETIERKIFLVRGQKVLLDNDLAVLYGVPTKVLLQAVKRNIKRFPADFMLPHSTLKCNK